MSRFRTMKQQSPVLVVLVLMFLSAACSGEKPDYMKRFGSRAAVPGMATDSVTTLISDSGRIRYRVVTEVWEVYDKASDPYWYFPKKVYFERFNDSLKTESLVQCDTAKYFTRRRLWELRKNVKLINLKGETFETQLLYWDQMSRRIYSDSFIRIEQENQTLMGYGFNSDEQMTNYTINKPTGNMPMDSEETNLTAVDAASKGK